MSQHPYLRAYMAGITVPTALLLVAMTGFTLLRYVYDVPFRIERVIVFPMAVIPNGWGLWNMLHLPLSARRRIPIGVHGAVLPLVLFPIAYLVTRIVQFEIPDFIVRVFPIALPITIAIYYLVWKHVVGFFNEVLGIAGQSARA